MSLTLGCGIALPHPYGKSATSEYLADPTGVPMKEYLSLFKHYAQTTPELELFVTGHVMISKSYRAEVGNVIVAEDAHETTDLMRQVSSAMHENGKVILAQINNGGRQIDRATTKRNGRPAFSCYDAASPAMPRFFPKPVCILDQLREVDSALGACLGDADASYDRAAVLKRMDEAFGTFAGATIKDAAHFADPESRMAVVTDIVGLFPKAAGVVTEKWGFDGAQMHIAHGYFLSEFLEFGLFNLLLYIAMKARNAVGPSKILAAKMNEFAALSEEGFRERHPAFPRFLGELDFVEVSAGTYARPVMASALTFGNFSLPFAKSVGTMIASCGLETKVMSTGRFGTLKRAEEVLSSDEYRGLVHMIGFGRNFCLPQPFAPNAEAIIRQGIPRMSKLTSKMMYFLNKFLPFAAVGPNTIYFGQSLRAIAHGQVAKNEDVERVLIPGNSTKWLVSLYSGMFMSMFK